MNQIFHGDCLEVMKSIPDGSIDAIITDPPYGMSFVSERRNEGSKHKAIEKDSDYCKVIEKRLKNTNPPLF